MNCLLPIILELSKEGFNTATDKLIYFIDNCDDFVDTLKEIGTIPECIEHDSTQEKLYAKASDAVLARAFREIGLKSTVLQSRGDSADVIAESSFHGYSLVADAKAFRLSRTAKNQKDYKVTALSGWRKDADYAVLCAPHFQYPIIQSQIYAQAVDNNVCLLSWEHIGFLIEAKIKENEHLNLSALWNISGAYAESCVVSKKKNCFIPLVNSCVTTLAGKNEADFKKYLSKRAEESNSRALREIDYWNREIIRISTYSREQAIEELLKAKKISEKIDQIRKYKLGIQKYG